MIRRLALILAGAGLLAVVFVLALQRVEASNRQIDTLTAPPTFHEGLALRLRPPDGEGDVSNLDGTVPFRFELESGETLGSVLGGLGLEPPEAYQLSTELAKHLEVRRLKAGSPYSAYLDDTTGLRAFSLAVDGEGEVMARRSGDAWQVSWRKFERTLDLHVATGQLDGALETAVTTAGAPAVVTFHMAEALQWDLDFNRDLRQGDTFRVLYETVYLDAQYHSVGRVLAVQYENRGRLVEAYRFGEDGGLYDEEGRPLRKMFLRSPLPYSRVTSQFSHRRFHPVLKTYRPHYGVDYGAPVGTPVRVTANGTVSFAGWNKGGGKTVKVRHPNNFETAYLHLSRFAKGMSPGHPVRQGDIVGYVGATGLATGPHLDYRVKHRGSYINPLSIKGVPADPIPQKDLPAFLEWRDILRASLEQGDPQPVRIARIPWESEGATPDDGSPAAPESDRLTSRSVAR